MQNIDAHHIHQSENLNDSMQAETLREVSMACSYVTTTADAVLDREPDLNFVMLHASKRMMMGNRLNFKQDKSTPERDPDSDLSWNEGFNADDTDDFGSSDDDFGSSDDEDGTYCTSHRAEQPLNEFDLND